MRSQADAVSFDLEDAVTQSKKGDARSAVAAFLRDANAEGQKVSIVRVNPLGSDLFIHDVNAVVGEGLDIINLPKVESGDEILRAIEAIHNAEASLNQDRQTDILANIETPKGLRMAFEIASAHPRVIGLQLGFTDFSLACGIHSQNKTALNAVRLAMRFAAAEAGIAVYDGAFVNVQDLAAFRVEAEEASELGFAGKSCIHPSQIAIANAVFSPAAEEIARAEALLRAADEADQKGIGAFVFEGKMVDVPIIARARSVVALAAKLGIASRT